MPVLVRLEREDIEEQFEIDHLGLAQHIHVIFDIITRKALHQLLHLFEGTLHRITVLIILVSWLTTNEDIELQLRRETRHIVEASA